MTETRRKYNKKNHYWFYYHPFNQICCGNCKDKRIDQKRRTEKKKILTFEVWPVRY